MPERIQQRRTKGWRMPLNARSVARPSKWGNGWRVIHRGGTWDVKTPEGDCLVRVHREEAAALAVKFHRDWIVRMLELNTEFHALLVTELAGRDLACYCALDMPCHSTTLLELANA
jgi:hypothetical protein